MDKIDKSFIAFYDDDDKKREDWVEVKEKALSYVSFKYKGRLITIPWMRVLKLREPEND